MKCSKCQGQVEKIARAGQTAFWFCRPCKLPHDENGSPLFTSKSLADRFNPLQAARDRVKRSHKGISPVARTALEMSLIQGYQEAYFAGLRDGVLLAYSQDYQEGEPMIEKHGVSNEQLRTELQTQYNDLKEKKQRLEQSPLDKQAAQQTHYEMEAVKAKLDELDNQA